MGNALNCSGEQPQPGAGKPQENMMDYSASYQNEHDDDQVASSLVIKKSNNGVKRNPALRYAILILSSPSR